ncbi:response regulator transcription factor [Chromobacterium vaccinii]|uniref:DNA-binding response regulator n=2 Tax=Chromobacterium vaccinii TaxID=1108595 RepID=A0A1D9LCE9_9NEIS|nr:response regulator [Chromobacterium vaccinii]AOZ48911.1 DNA-binding response regulator [Chromobacterium vaccinii]QND85313.1 LuxR family two-component transcriptional response regulator [Chromobacterium vaccinii]QND90544.1 LuxR family two-component transcriptional response regulator [Chromobacterium vaccinii]SUX54317.1 Transcriptional regulatory protein fixJ [Chromobacterium vaccinii]
MQNTTPTVFIVDDDPAVLDSLAMLITAQGMKTVAFPNAMEFLDGYQGNQICCLVLDIRMPQITGLALQQQLMERDINIPIVFITGHGDIEQCRRAFQTGAIDFLTKPIDQNRLIASLRRGIRISIQQHQQEEETQEVMSQLARISGREREVLELVADGLSSKEIARELDLSPRTIEVHRANLFSKLGVDSLADLVRFYLKALEATGKKQRIDEEILLNEFPPNQ